MRSRLALVRTSVRPGSGMSHRLPHPTSCDRTCAHRDRDGLSASHLGPQDPTAGRAVPHPTLVSLPYRGPYAVGVGETPSLPPLRHEEGPLTWPPPVRLRRAGSPAARYGGNVWMRAPPEDETGWNPLPSPGHINRPLHIGLRQPREAKRLFNGPPGQYPRFKIQPTPGTADRAGWATGRVSGALLPDRFPARGPAAGSVNWPDGAGSPSGEVSGASLRTRHSLSYSSWRRHQTPVSLRPSGARSSHWYMPQRPSSPRAYAE